MPATRDTSDYLTPVQFAIKWKKSRVRVYEWLREDRIPGVIRIGWRMLIPKDAKCPELKRAGRKCRKPVELSHSKLSKSK